MATVRITATLLAALWVCGCSIAHRHDGTPNEWRGDLAARIEVGTTSQQDVIGLFGPPTGIIELHEKTVFAYVLRYDYTTGLTLVVFNYYDTDIHYDRAVFFFDADEVLETYSFSKKPLERYE